MTMLEHIEAQIDALIAEHHTLQQKYAAIEAERTSWQHERVKLIEKNDMARTRIEFMIERLKTLESES